jgi:hypothetical protein
LYYNSTYYSSGSYPNDQISIFAYQPYVTLDFFVQGAIWSPDSELGDIYSYLLQDDCPVENPTAIPNSCYCSAQLTDVSSALSYLLYSRLDDEGFAYLSYNIPATVENAYTVISEYCSYFSAGKTAPIATFTALANAPHGASTSKNLSGGAKAGIAVGVIGAVGLAVLAVLAFLAKKIGLFGGSAGAAAANSGSGAAHMSAAGYTDPTAMAAKGHMMTTAVDISGNAAGTAGVNSALASHGIGVAGTASTAGTAGMSPAMASHGLGAMGTAGASSIASHGIGTAGTASMATHGAGMTGTAGAQSAFAGHGAATTGMSGSASTVATGPTMLGHGNILTSPTGTIGTIGTTSAVSPIPVSPISPPFTPAPVYRSREPSGSPLVFGGTTRRLSDSEQQPLAQNINPLSNNHNPVYEVGDTHINEASAEQPAVLADSSPVHEIGHGSQS